MADWKPEDRFPESPYMRGLPPLRVPGGWRIAINDLDVNARAEEGGLGGSSLFLAVNEGRRFLIEAMFRPEVDPNGAFALEVRYRPWPRTEKGRRRNDIPFEQAPVDDRIVHAFETRSMTELLERLQHWIARCSVWTLEGN
jgi:hypothetical protein